MSPITQPTTWLDAIRAALRRPRALNARLYFDGDQLRWLARPLPGWMRVAVPVRLLIDLDEAA